MKQFFCVCLASMLLASSREILEKSWVIYFDVKAITEAFLVTLHTPCQFVIQLCFVLSIFIPVCPRQNLCTPPWHSLPTSMCFSFPLELRGVLLASCFPPLKYVFEKAFVCFLERVCYTLNRD